MLLQPRSWWQKWARMWHRVPSAPPGRQRKMRIGKDSHTVMDTVCLYSSIDSVCKHWFCCSRPPLRGFLMDGDFYVAASLATTLTKVALRYVAIVQDKKKQNVSCPVTLNASPFSKSPNQWLFISSVPSPAVLCRRGHADHGHCAAPGQVFSA